MTTLRVTRVVVDGRPYFPIVDGAGRYLEMDQIAALSTTLGQPRAAGARRLGFIMFDESDHALEAWNVYWNLEPDQQRQIDLPLELNAGTGLEIGTVEAVTLKAPGAIPGTTGHGLIGEARLHNTALADVAWQAIHDTVYTHVCCEVLTLDADFRRTAEAALRLDPRCEGHTITPLPPAAILSVALMPTEGAHKACNRILEAWETPARSSPLVVQDAPGA